MSVCKIVRALTSYLQDYKCSLGAQFEIAVAFSRVSTEKVYVQHKLQERAAEINKLLAEEHAHFYVCGDAANMAREVHEGLIEIISQQRGLERVLAEEVLKGYRSVNRYQEDVW